MASTFNLLTAGGARFDKQKFKHDIELFGKVSIDPGLQRSEADSFRQRRKEKAKRKSNPPAPMSYLTLSTFSGQLPAQNPLDHSNEQLPTRTPTPNLRRLPPRPPLHHPPFQLRRSL